MLRFSRYFFENIEAFCRSDISRKSKRYIDEKSTLLFRTVSRKGNVKSKMWLRRLIEIGHTELVDNDVVPFRPVDAFRFSKKSRRHYASIFSKKYRENRSFLSFRYFSKIETVHRLEIDAPFLDHVQKRKC
jgi:hypothetical protein